MARIDKTKKDLAIVCPQAKLKQKLGAGGNGDVYRAVHSIHGKVAIKFFLNSERHRWLRFLDEVKVVTTRLKDSPRVVPILEHQLSNTEQVEISWYVMPEAALLHKSLLFQR